MINAHFEITDIRKLEVSKNVSLTFESLINMFDGIEVDFEFKEGNSNPSNYWISYLDTLNHTKVPKNKTFSVASMPISKILSDSTWNSDYYNKISKIVDKIEVMTYNSGLDYDRDYQEWIKMQAINISNAVIQTKNNHISIGLPTYDGYTSYHKPAENIKNGAMGLKSALDNDLVKKKTLGVSIYFYNETSESEWCDYHRFWLEDNSYCGSCVDGIKNGNEEDIDCGESCNIKCNNSNNTSNVYEICGNGKDDDGLAETTDLCNDLSSPYLTEHFEIKYYYDCSENKCNYNYRNSVNQPHFKTFSYGQVVPYSVKLIGDSLEKSYNKYL
jgi:hypothetical protein